MLCRAVLMVCCASLLVPNVFRRDVTETVKAALPERALPGEPDAPAGADRQGSRRGRGLPGP